MCRPVTCRRCGGTTWAGCGRHVEQVLADVPVERRCRCTPVAAGVAPAEVAGPRGARRRRWFGR